METKTKTKIKLRGTKRKFMKLGGCSHLMFHIINRQFDEPRVSEEKASDLLAGGIMQHGYQCGMLWGSSMAAGAEAYRRCKDKNKATALAIIATQKLMESFKSRTGYHECADITETNWHKKSSMASFFIKGKFVYCFKLAEKWAPEAVEIAFEALEHNPELLPANCTSCASEMAHQWGATDEQCLMVAGFAGGLGLSGGGCGALAAAVWLNTLEYNKSQEGKTVFNNPAAQKAIDALYTVTDYETLCSDITQQKFDTLQSHTAFLEKDGCKKVIETLAKSKVE